MEKNTQISEIIVSTSDKAQSKAITLLKQSGKIVKIASRVYTSNLSDSPEKIVRRNLFLILGKLFPGAVISHRSALEMVPTPDGHLYLTYNYTRNIVLPGVTVHLLEGPGHVENDIPLLGLYISSPARAFLENLQVGYKKNGSSKCLDQKALEERLEKKLLVHGEQELNVIRDEARTLAGILGMEDSFACLDRIIGAMLTTKSSDVLKSPVAMAQVMGEPYDSERLSRLMMNAELTAAKCAKIIIPTVFRTDYLDALRRLTRNDDPSVLIRALERVRLFSSKLDGTDYDSLMLALEQSNAFKDEEEYILRF